MFATQSLKRAPITLVLMGIALLLHAASDLQPWFALHFRELSGLGLYRVLTCHLLHWSTNHLVWDIAVFFILGAWCECRSPGRFSATLLLSGAAIPLCIMYFLPQIDSYRGLSGIDSALFGLLAADLLANRIKDRDRSGTICFSLFFVSLFGKIAWETIAGGNIFVSDPSFTPVPLSHLIGAMIGVGVGWSAWPPRNVFRRVSADRENIICPL